MVNNKMSEEQKIEFCIEDECDQYQYQLDELGQLDESIALLTKQRNQLSNELRHDEKKIEQKMDELYRENVQLFAQVQSYKKCVNIQKIISHSKDDCSEDDFDGELSHYFCCITEKTDKYRYCDYCEQEPNDECLYRCCSNYLLCESCVYKVHEVDERLTYDNYGGSQRGWNVNKYGRFECYSLKQSEDRSKIIELYNRMLGHKQLFLDHIANGKCDVKTSKYIGYDCWENYE